MKQKSFKAFLLSLLLITASSSSFAQPDFDLPVGMSLEYVFYRGSTKLGTMERTLTQTDKNIYLLESNVKVTHFLAKMFLKGIEERSTFTFENGRAKALAYQYNRSGSKKRRHQDLQFDWQTRKVSDATQDTPWSIEVPENTVDRHLYQLNVMFDMQDEPKALQYLVADRGKLKTYDIKNLGNEMIKTPLGEIDTIKLQRKSEKRSTTVWVAADYNYLPVQIEQNEKGDTYRSVIKKISGL